MSVNMLPCPGASFRGWPKRMYHARARMFPLVFVLGYERVGNRSRCLLRIRKSTYLLSKHFCTDEWPLCLRWNKLYMQCTSVACAETVQTYNTKNPVSRPSCMQCALNTDGLFVRLAPQHIKKGKKPTNWCKTGQVLDTKIKRSVKHHNHQNRFAWLGIAR